MKIGYFTSSFPYKNPLTGEEYETSKDGGVENVAYNLAIEMIKRGHEIVVFTSSINSTESIEDYGNLKVYRYKKKFTVGLAPIPIGLLYKPINTDMDFDIIHTQVGNLPAPLTALIYSRVKKVPLIASYYEDYLGGFGSLSRRMGVFLFNNFLAYQILSGARSIIVSSEYYTNVSKILPKYRHKLRYIPVGIHLDEFNLPVSKEEAKITLGLPLDKKIILFVGSLTPRKAPHILVKAMANVIKKNPESHLVIVGDGYMKTELNESVLKLGINNNVVFTGYVKDEIKLLYYKSADLFILPSFSEGFGIVLLEASAFGLPLIVSDLEVFKTIVKDGYNGLFAKRGDYEDLANKINCILENEGLRLRMGECAKLNALDFSWESIVDNILQTYSETINNDLEANI